MYKRMSALRRYAATGLLGTTLAFGGCEFGQIEAGSSITFDSRDVVTSLIRSWVLGPIETAIDTGIDRLFDALENEGDG